MGKDVERGMARGGLYLYGTCGDPMGCAGPTVGGGRSVGWSGADPNIFGCDLYTPALRHIFLDEAFRERTWGVSGTPGCVTSGSRRVTWRSGSEALGSPVIRSWLLEGCQIAAGGERAGPGKGGCRSRLLRSG